MVQWFARFEGFWGRFYEPDYRNVTQKLLYEEISYDYAIENRIVLVANSDVFVYKAGDIKKDGLDILIID